MDVIYLQFPLSEVWKLVEHALSCPHHFWDEELELEDIGPALLLSNAPSFHLRSNGYGYDEWLAARSPMKTAWLTPKVGINKSPTSVLSRIALRQRPSAVFAVGFDPAQDDTVVRTVQELCDGESWTEQLVLDAKWERKLQNTVTRERLLLSIELEDGLTGEWIIEHSL